MDEIADVRSVARTLDDLDPLLDRVGDAHLVLLGEASHGTHEYYAWRDRISRRLIEDKGFTFIAVEGDWPDCRQLHRFVTGALDDIDEVMHSYDRWPTWMWSNTAVREAACWLRAFNTGRADPVGFHGLDVYSLQRSMREVIGWLREHEPDLVKGTIEAYRCFEPYGPDPFDYAQATRLVPETCEQQVIDVLKRMCERDGGEEDRFAAEQNAAVVAGAEAYYRAAVGGGPHSWNVRDVHMADTLDRLLEHSGGKGIVWAHNTHIGDARATDMADAGMVNLGQLARERHGEDGVVLVGFAGHRGTVVAAHNWGAPAQTLPVPPARDGSAEDLLHEALGDTPSLLVFPPSYDQPRWLRTSLDHRAIGVVYHPERERWGNYVPSTLGDRYDAFVFFGETTALTPMRPEPAGDPEPETAPWGV